MRGKTTKSKALITEKFINLSSCAMAAAAFLFFLTPPKLWPDFYSPTFFGFVFLGSSILIIMPKYIFKPADEKKREAIKSIQSALASALVLNGLGEIYLYQLYKYGLPYDKIIHFLSSFFFVLVLVYFGQIWKNLPFKKALVTAITVVLAGGLIWEMFEFLSDFLFKTSEFGIYGLNKTSDTLLDLLFDFLGVTSGIILLNFKKGGKTTREIILKAEPNN